LTHIFLKRTRCFEFPLQTHRGKVNFFFISKKE
jgi:hypothetical protein